MARSPFFNRAGWKGMSGCSLGRRNLGFEEVDGERSGERIGAAVLAVGEETEVWE